MCGTAWHSHLGWKPGLKPASHPQVCTARPTGWKADQIAETEARGSAPPRPGPTRPSQPRVTCLWCGPPGCPGVTSHPALSPGTMIQPPLISTGADEEHTGPVGSQVRRTQPTSWPRRQVAGEGAAC